MRAVFSVTVDNTDYTSVISDRLKSLTLTDVAGFRSDFIEIALDDRAPAIKVPAHGAVIKVALGYAGGALLDKGAYTHSETDFEFPPSGMLIRATAANLRAAFRAARTRSFDNVTLGDVVASIAKEHGYQALVAPELAGVTFTHLDQVEESDIALLTRLARDQGAMFKSAGGALVIIPSGYGRNPMGKILPTITLRPEHVTTLTVTRHDRDRAGAIVAKWQDFGAAELRRVQAGSGTPVIELGDLYPDDKLAYAAAAAELKRRQRSSATGSVTLPGDPTLMAEARLVLESFRDGVDGEYTITQVKHVIDKKGGYKCMAEFEQKTGIAEAAVQGAADG